MKLARAFLALTLAATIPAPAVAQTFFVTESADASANNDGLWTSLALDASGNVHVSYKDETTDDLKYARKAGGVWTTETADGSANNVGDFTSLALDASRNPHVSYFDLTTTDLKYARKSGGVWTRETADGSANFVGNFISLALDVSGNPHVSYEDFSVGDLKYTRKSGGAWIIETVDGLATNVGRYSSLALDASGNPHVSYFDVSTFDLKYAWKAGGVWTRETADFTNDLGYYTSLALDASGNPHVSYFDFTTSNLKYARKSGGVWTIETADASANNVGVYSSLALDAQGNAHVSYYDATNRDLKYARKSSGAWIVETADGSVNDVGAATSIALDAAGNPHVSYYDATTTDLKYASAAVHLVSPQGGVTWAVGSLQNVVWSGVGTVSITAATDGTTFDIPLVSGITTSPIPIRVPHLPTRFARIKVERSSPFSFAVSDSFFRIDATIALAKFDATRGEDGTRLTWETRPGPEADIRYRIERGIDSAHFTSIADGLDRGEFVDASPTTASRYRLIAINGLGEEYVLGETSVAAALAADRDIVAYPNPAGVSVQIAFRVLTDRPLTLDVFDTSGRRVRSLVSGNLPAGVHSATWDRRDESGRDVSAGTYFLRMRSAIGYDVTERVTIVR